MNFIFIPLNEGQEMNLIHRFTFPSKNAAIDHAQFVAKTMQNLFPKASISVEVATEKKFNAGKKGLVIFAKTK